MQSDVERLFSESKPPLASIMNWGRETSHAKQYAALQTVPHKPKAVFFIAFSLTMFVLASVFGYWFFFMRIKPAVKPTPAATTPPPLFFTEQVATAGGTLENKVFLLQTIESAVLSSAPEGSFAYIPVKLRKEEGEYFVGAEDFFALYGIQPPPDFFLAHESFIMPFVYYSAEGPRFGFLMKSRDPKRTLQNMLIWEPSLFKNMFPLFFKETPNAVVAPFENKTFRNIDWRLLKLSDTKDIGIAYAIFPAKKALIVTTGQDAIETVINRLYEEL